MKNAFTFGGRRDLADPERKKDCNLELFSGLAPTYDRINPLLSLGRDAAWKRALVHGLPDRAAPVCVDLACGTGDLTGLLARRYPGARIVGLDLAEPMLEIARRRLPGPGIEFVRADMNRTGLPDSSVDIVTGGYALRNAPEIRAAIAEVARMLKPGGAAAFLEFAKPVSRPARALSYLFLKLWGGFWGCLIHRNPALYTYIAESLMVMPDRRALRALFEEHGLRLVRERRHYLGMLETLYFERRGVER